MTLYEATDGDNWTNNSNWGTNWSLHTWQGVTTNDEGQVLKLDLHNNNLSGELPDSLGNLVNLEYLDLSVNHIEGVIPESLGNLVNLDVLGLQENQLEGAIPDSFGRLSRLHWLDLS